jgi:hypothetical protein
LVYNKEKESIRGGKAMTKHELSLTIVLFFLFLAATHGYASDNDFRCDSKFVSLGDRTYEVLAKCGEPSHRDVRVEKRIALDLFRELNPKTERDRNRVPLFVEDFVKVEDWIYNFGSTRFMRFLRFEDGRLVEIETGDYGF